MQTLDVQPMETQTVAEALRHYIAANILFSKDYPYPDEASFLENGIIDSMNVLELVTFLEENWSIQAADNELIPDNFDSVSQLAAFVQRKLAA
jgi:acyl carrier protein